MRKLIIFALAVSSCAIAQEVSKDEINGRIAALEQQRNAQANDVVTLAGRLSAANAEIDRLKKAAIICASEKPLESRP